MRVATCPSTPGQLELGRLLVEELKELGLKGGKQDEKGYVYATLPSNIEKEVPPIGFIAHMDTAPDLMGSAPILRSYTTKVETFLQ